jgi:predicted small secreted protein
MATVTHEITTASTTNATTYTSASFTPAVNDLLVAMVAATDTVATGSMTGSAGPSWTLYRSDAFTQGTITTTIYIFVTTSLVTSATAQTVTFDCTGDAATGSIIHVAAINGITRTGTSAFKQAASSTFTSTPPPSVTLPSASISGNPLIGIYCAVDTAGTVPTSAGTGINYTAGGGGTTSYTNPATRSNYQYWANPTSSQTAVAWSSGVGGSGTTSGRATAFEIDTSAVASTLPRTIIKSGGVIGR